MNIKYSGENTSKALIRKFFEFLAKKVSTVNSVAPDANGNVDIDIPIDWFGNGKALGTASNLDNQTTVGKYYAPSNSTAEKIANSPTKVNFVLYVFQRGLTNIRSQLIVDLNGRMFVRSRSSSGWNKWCDFATADDLTAYLKTVNGITPDEGGNVTLTAENVGALPASDAAADAAKLGGKTWEERLLDIYPVGSIYMSVSSTSPASLFGGTWEQLKDRFLLGAGSTYTNGNTGGSATHKLSVNEIPSHSHPVKERNNGQSVTTTGWSLSIENGKYTSNTADMYVGNTGGGAAHNNMPPYLVVYMWKRVS